MASFLSPLLWSLLPAQLTHAVLPYLTSTLPALFPRAPRGSPIYLRNYRWAFTLLVTAYLAYSFLQDNGDEKEDWYTLLAVDRFSDDDVLRKAFRKLSRTYHPDRSGGQHDEHFIRIRQAYEGLTDPVRRYAYDRFGPDVLQWKAKNVKEYMYTGLTRSAGFYVVSFGLIVLLSVIGRAQDGAYWRYTLFAILLYLELHLVLSPTSPEPSLVTSQPPFRIIRTLHKIWTSLGLAISQLAGVWADQSDNVSLEQVMVLARSLEAEAVTQCHNEVGPLLSISGNPQAVEAAFQAEMEQILVDRTLASHPYVKSFWLSAAARLARQTPHIAQPRRDELYIASRIPLPPSPPPSP